MDRTLDGVVQKIKDLRLIRRKMNPYTEEEKKYILDHLKSKTITQIAKDLGRTQGGVSKYVSKFRIKNIRKTNKTYLENIDKDIPPFFSKGDNYFEIIENICLFIVRKKIFFSLLEKQKKKMKSNFVEFGG